MKTPSLRAHVMLGAMLWTIGLFIIASALLIVSMQLHPDVPIATSVHGAFSQPLVVMAGLLAMCGGFIAVRRGLSSIANLRASLVRLHEGRDRRIEGTYASEVQPLVNDLNALLEQREAAVQRAVAKAGDLAHGLKTPLTILAHEAERARTAGDAHVAADVVAHEVERMRRQIDYHLAQARAAASSATPGTRCSVLDTVEGLTRAMLRLHADRHIGIDVRVPPGATVLVHRQDLEEMLGNLLDNACKWGRSSVRVEAAQANSTVTITVDDDGRGLPLSMREAVLQRGVRVDEAAEGSGLGLAIVRDLAEIYRGSISLAASPSGGLRAQLVLPT
jgi:signal transduction histidine kinase